jgi:quaternary ammonium compound-resistance protein SugE
LHGPVAHRAHEDDLDPTTGNHAGRPDLLKEGHMAWVFLGIAGVLEVLWAYMLKISDGLSKPVEGTIAVVAMIASFIVLSLAMKSLPLGTAYTIWTGIGAIGAFVIGIAVLGEAATPLRIGSAVLILAGIIGLKLASEV